MAGFGTDAAIAAAAPAARPTDRFASLWEGQLDSLYAPLIYLMSEDEQGIYPSLTLEGKRSFLRKFWARRDPTRSEEHTSELQSLAYLVCRLLLEKKKISTYDLR